MLQRDLLDNNMPRISALRIAVLTDVNFTDKERGESSLHAAQLIQQILNDFLILGGPVGICIKIHLNPNLQVCPPNHF